MPSLISTFGPTAFSHSADADLLTRLGIALAARQRAAWRAVQLRVHNGIVRLHGIVPTFHDRQLILSVAQHVAGVLQVEDELAIAEPASGRSIEIAERVALASEFDRLPPVPESLEEILQQVESPAAAV